MRAHTLSLATTPLELLLARVREHARVPIVNFKDGQTGLEVDISLAAAVGLPAETTALVASLREEHTALEPLALILKVLLEQAGLNQPYTGGLGSFKLYVLIAHYLTQRNAAGHQVEAELLLIEARESDRRREFREPKR